MPKRNSETTSGNDKAKVRVFFAEVEGNNESIQEALQTMVSAMSRPVRVIADHKLNGKPELLLPETAVAEVEDATEQPDDAEAPPAPASSDNARRPRGTGKRTDRNAGLTLVPDLNFRPDGQPTLKDFIDQKNPKNDMATVLAVVYYMQHSMNLNRIGPSHVMTAIKELGKAVPVDVRQTIRNVKNAKVWLTYTDIEEIRTTTQGDNFVEYEMATAADS
jgi:hypothetical protein